MDDTCAAAAALIRSRFGNAATPRTTGDETGDAVCNIAAAAIATLARQHGRTPSAELAAIVASIDADTVR